VPALNPYLIAAALLLLAPYLAAAFFPARLMGSARRLPVWAQVVAPALLTVAYMLVTVPLGAFSLGWCALYAGLPVALTATVLLAPHDNRRFYPLLIALLVIGLSVDLRWFERAWPPHLSIFNKVLLLDGGIYAFFMLRPLGGTGFDLRLRARDLTTGLREFLFYLPIALLLGLGTGFLHIHAFAGGAVDCIYKFAKAWTFTFFFIAVPEELFFRGWLQNLLETRVGRNAALVVTSILFGLAHFNKRAVYFNWRYVLLAAFAGFFYGRAWRRDRRVGASAVTHATVDSLWSLFLR
jgi:membrane protease YdiL (CAAX protease family)